MQQPTAASEANTHRNQAIPRGAILAAALPAVLWLLSITTALLDRNRPRLTHGLRWILLEGPFFDFTAYRQRVASLHTPQFLTLPGYPWFYPAPCIFLFEPFTFLARVTGNSHLAIAAFLLASLALAVLAAICFTRALVRRGIARTPAALLAATLLLFSWPLYFAMERGNVELLIWPILALATFAYARGRFTLAAICIGVAGALKLYPLLCLGLFISPRRYRELALALATTLGITLLALLQIGPTIPIAAHSIASAIASWTRQYAVSYDPGSVSFDHTGYELLKFATASLHPAYPALEHHYLVSAALIAAVVFLLWIRRLSRTNQVTFCLAAMIFLPPASFDYTLLHVYVPMGWLLLVLTEQSQRAAPTGRLLATLLLCSLLVGPETFLLYHGTSYNSLFKAALLLLLIGASCVPLPDLGLAEPLSPETDPLRT